MSKLIFQRCSLILNYNCLSYVNRQKKKKIIKIMWKSLDVIFCDMVDRLCAVLCNPIQSKQLI